MQQHSGVIRNLVSGVLIGIGCILPGVSGGVMAVSFGLYRPMLEAAAGFFHAPLIHLRFLAPIALGIAAGMATGAFGLAGVMEHAKELVLFLFTGFILGGIPDLVREASRRDRFSRRWLWAMLAGVAAALPLCTAAGSGAAVDSLAPLQALTTGLLEGVGTIVPGISTSFVLIRLGWYQAYLEAVARLNVPVLAWILCGFAVSAAASMRMVQYLFERWPGPSYYAVLGFLLVSVASVFPGFSKSLAPQVLLLAAGVLCVRWMGDMNNKEVRK